MGNSVKHFAEVHGSLHVNRCYLIVEGDQVSLHDFLLKNLN